MGEDTAAASGAVAGVSSRLAAAPGRIRHHGAAWVVDSGSYFFASERGEPLIRRRADLVSLVVASALVVVSARADQEPSSFLDSLSKAFSSLPSWVDSLLAATFVVASLYSLALLLAALLRRRPGLFWGLLLAVVVAVVVAALLGRLVTGDWPAFGSIGSILGEPEPSYPVVRLSALNAVLLTAAPHLSRPYRRFGFLLVLVCGFAALALELGVGAGVIASLGLGWGAAALVHLIFGSPAGAPPTVRVERALRQLGVDAVELERLPERIRGAAFHRARTRDGRVLLVKVYGRDSISARSATRFWRYLSRRGTSLDPTASRRELVEHTALSMLLAQRAGVRVPDLVAVGVARPRDALIASEWAGEALADVAVADLTDAHLASAWSSLGRAHAAGIEHGDLDPTTVRVHAGEVVLTGWSASVSEATPEGLANDDAAMLVTTAVAAGPERAVRAARSGLGTERIEEALSYVQPAALNEQLRSAIRAADLDLDELRRQAAEATGTEAPELVKLRRVTLGAAVMFIFIAIAAWSLITWILGIGVDSIIDAVATADVFWLAAALIIGQTPQVAQQVAVQGATPVHIAFLPGINAQLAIGFLNLAAPNTAVRVAATTRFLQKQGSSVSAALSAGVFIAVARLIVQLGLVLGLVLTDVVDFGVSLEIDTSDFDGTILLVLLGIIAAVGAVILFVPRYRARVAESLRGVVHGVKQALSVFRSLGQVVQLFGGNLASEVLLAITLGIVVHAYGLSLSLATLVVIQSGTAIINGFVPIPGGIGVWEMLLSTALVAAGVPESDAIAIAISYRLVTFYLPPIWGWFAMRWLTRNDYM